jgi:putative ABC transport system substrate-binding protein
MYDNREVVEGGGPMYYGADLADSYRRVAYHVEKVLKGAKLTDLPVQQPTKFEFVINLKMRAEKVINSRAARGLSGESHE